MTSKPIGRSRHAPSRLSVFPKGGHLGLFGAGSRLLRSERALVKGSGECFEWTLAEASLHLGPAPNAELHGRGWAAWAVACAAVGLPFERLRDTTADIVDQLWSASGRRRRSDAGRIAT
jgi:hypothetical protein